VRLAEQPGRAGGGDPVKDVVVLDGNRFYVADPHGDASSGSEGLYADDVRVLRRWRMQVNGERPALLGGGEDGAHFCWSVYGQILDRDASAAPRMSTRRQLRVSQAGLRETLSVTNHGHQVERVVVRYEFDADFADLFEVKRRELGKPDLLFARSIPPVSTTREWLPKLGAYRFSAEERRMDGRPRDRTWRTGVQVSFSELGVPGEGEAFFDVEVPPRSTWRIQAYVVLLGDDLDAEHSDPDDELGRAEQEALHRVERWQRAVPVLETPSAPLAETYRRSVADLAALRMHGIRHDHEEALLPAAGLPWFMAVFGRDTIITCLLTMALGQDLARTALRALGHLQATGDDAARDAEPGKILHELRVGKVAALGSSLPYYGSADSTPLYLMLAAETWRWTGDDELMRELEPNLRAAAGWIEGPADLTGRGYVEFRRRSDRGIDVQSWKDSRNSMLFADGSPASPPLAVCEVQGYAYAARLGLADIARTVWGDEAYADRLERDAQALRERFDRDFWVETPAGGHYALALDPNGRRVDSLTSDIGHLLVTGIAADSRTDRIAEALLGPDLFSGWGVRTMSTGDLGYNPAEYHDGTVWPHDTAIACMGLARRGRLRDAAVLLRALLDAAAHFDWRLPEVLTGYPREDTRFPVLYPTSCSPQAWAAAAPLGALTAVLGLTPDRATRTLTAPHRVPDDLDVTLRGVWAFGRRWDVVAEHGQVNVLPTEPRSAVP
jgi:glycogen debranching enzyme